LITTEVATIGVKRDGDVRAIGYIQRNYIAYGLRHLIAHYETVGG
jgi:hypothetical protein